MQKVPPIRTVSDLSTATLGVFSGSEAGRLGVSRKQLATLAAAGLIERELPGVYRVTVVERSAEQRLRAALMWGGDDSAAASVSAGEHYGLEGVRAARPEVTVAKSRFPRVPGVVVHHSSDEAALMIREYRGLRVTGIEAALCALAHALDGEAFEVACEDARRRRLTTVPALRAYLDRFGHRGRHGVSSMRALLDQLDPQFPSRSTLEVRTRRLLVANGFRDFEREFALEWNGKRYRYDFGFVRRRAILETNGRRWHDDATDYERDNEKWSVPGRHGFRIVFATWEKVTKYPDDLLADLAATLGR